MGLAALNEQKKLMSQQLFTLLDLCVSSLRRGHANILCIVPFLTDDCPYVQKKQMSILLALAPTPLPHIIIYNVIQYDMSVCINKYIYIY